MSVSLPSATKVPATVLTGFLGAGKTTLLNRILNEDPGKQIAVVVNEFGEIGIDHQLVASSDEDIIEMNNGCICCQVRGDLIRIFDEIFSRHENIDHIVIETTGLADPAPIIQSFMVDDRVCSRLALDAIVTVVDARHISFQLEQHEAQEQIAFADIILINKIDLVSPAELERVEGRIRSLNRYAVIHRTEHSAINLADVLDTRRFDVANVLEIEPGLLEEEGHEHDASVGAICIDRLGALDSARFNRWTFDLGQEYASNLFRIKGVLNLDDAPRRFIFQGVHMTFDGRPGKPWRDEPRQNQLVIIGRNLDRRRIESQFDACMLDTLCGANSYLGGNR